MAAVWDLHFELILGANLKSLLHAILEDVLKMPFGTDLELILNTVAKRISKIISAMCLCIWVLDFNWILIACRFPEGCFFKRFV